MYIAQSVRASASHIPVHLQGCAELVLSDLGLPENCLLILVTRQGRRMRPRGSTVLNPGDEVYAYSPRELFPVLQIRLVGERPS